MGAVDVAVVVVTYNSSAVVEDLIASLPAGLDGLTWTLTVADNDSSDDVVEKVQHLAPWANVVRTGRNGGYAAGINAAIAAAPARRAVLVLNPDVRLAPGCVAPLIRLFDDPTVGIAVPRLLDARGSLIVSQRREPTLMRAWADALVGAERAGRYGRLGEVVTDPRAYSGDTDTDWAEGSTLLISQACLRECGPWDESFFLYSEESEFALRARDRGFRTRYTPTGTAVHLEGGSAGSPGSWSLLVLNRVRLYRRRHGRAATAAFWAAVMVRESSRAVLGRPVNQAAVRALVSPSRWREEPGPDSIRWAPRRRRGAPRQITAGASEPRRQPA